MIIAFAAWADVIKKPGNKKRWSADASVVAQYIELIINLHSMH